MRPVTNLMRALYGSHLYGTSTPSSDTDYKSVHLPSGEGILLGRPEMTVGKSGGGKAKNSAEDIDDESFSLAKFFQMLEVGDMMAMELLFVPDDRRLSTSPLWAEVILANRHRLIHSSCTGFVADCQRQAAKYGIKGSRVREAREALAFLDALITRAGRKARLKEFDAEIRTFAADGRRYTSIQTIVQTYGTKLPHLEVCDRKMPFTITLETARSIMDSTLNSYGERANQAERNENIDWKSVMHAIRVGEQAIELLSTGHITFPRPNAAELIRVRIGEVDFNIIRPRLESLLDEVTRLSDTSTLPVTPDLDFIRETTLALHKHQIGA